MPPHQLPYACSICGWKGTENPTEPGDGAMCPNCGCLVYPRAWSDSWGLAILLIGLCVGLVALVAFAF
jgi:DNA-directed RNA polymerase subunit RPC12/RpoP